VEPVDGYNVLGTRVSALTLERTVHLLRERIRNRAQAYVCVCTVNDIVESLRRPDVRASINGAWLATSDGMPLVWWGRLSGRREIGRVYGPDILRAVLSEPSHVETRHFFYGGTQQVLDRLEAKAREINPDLKLAGKLAPPFRPLSEAEEEEHARLINEARPDIVWVGLGCPKQNLWMARFRPRLEAPVLVGVGAAFDFLAGVKRQAPRWVQRSGFEWLFRLLCEPRRLWRRYLVNNSIFLAHAFAYWSGLRDYPLEPPPSRESPDGPSRGPQSAGESGS
jgi:N-acetylglucosaminyldiphosphoundecaprenol N-acetyl-beta-D-mannosaminyltransferase